MMDFLLWLRSNTATAWHVASACAFAVLLVRVWWLERSRDSWREKAESASFINHRFAEIANGIERLTRRLSRREDANDAWPSDSLGQSP